jgi:pSer/pThr/pTyr-binding forkhead associated (FHA) protein
MNSVTVISRKTPKTKRPIDKKVYTISSSLRRTPFDLKKNKKFTIGRASKNTMSLKAGTVSEVHASIKWDKSSFKIKDERSTNGTFVNGKRISGVTILKSGDKIKVGQFVLTYGVKKVREKPAPAKKKSASKKKKAKAKSAQRKPAKKTSRKKAKKAVRSRAKKTTARKRPASRRKPARKPFQRDMAVTRIRF